jgi:hypothetical protein
MFEHRLQPLLSSRRLLIRLAKAAVISLAVITFSLAIGLLGYHWSEHLGWLDALLNAAMILSGEGPIHIPVTAAGKWFATAYALYSGLAYFVASGILVTPVAHRLLHHFHLEGDLRRD